MSVVVRWTGREAALLRQALRLSVRDFAAYLGIGTRTINKWEARQATITQRPHMQEVLDTALSQASDERSGCPSWSARRGRHSHRDRRGRETPRLLAELYIRKA